MSLRVAVVGAGAWGTAMALHLASRAHAAPSVTLCFRDAAQAARVSRTRENARYLPGIELPRSLNIAADLAPASNADVILVAAPAAALAEVADGLRARGASAPLLWLCKGFVEAGTADGGALLAHQSIAPRWPAPVGVVSGPSFADEVARGQPTALVVAATHGALASTAAALLRADMLRAYESDDIVSVEVGGALKNVMAIAAGASDGLGFGHNARAALITRGLAEMARLAATLGGRRDTLMGLAGLGDLVLTCTGDASRNRRVGLALAAGESLDAILARLAHVAEGVNATRAAHALAQHLRIDMPVTEAVFGVLHQGVGVRTAVETLLRREPRREDAG
ncbi:MAG: NAD(P)H-dependent glycerol-3-phosphate dehydrogenase [Casimicrobiaceae bacterium]